MAKEQLSNEERIEILKTGISSQFWGLLQEYTQENIRMLEEQILTKLSLEQGHYDELLTDLEVDRLRDKRSALIDITQLPQVVIDSLRETSDNKEEDDLDPYMPAPKE